MNINDLFELVIGTIVFLFTLIGSVVVANKIIHLFIPQSSIKGSRNINVLFLSFHLIIIVGLVVLIRSLFYKYMKNKNIVNAIFTLTGPIIGLTSFYMADTLHAFINY